MDNIVKNALGRTFYDPVTKGVCWNLDVEFKYENLTEEQEELARNIIEENNKGYGVSVLHNILNALAYAGFRGEIQSNTDITTPTVILINSKTEKP